MFSEEIVLGSFIPTWLALGFPLCPALSVPSFSVALVFSFRESGENLGPLQSMKGTQSFPTTQGDTELLKELQGPQNPLHMTDYQNFSG